MAATFHPKRKNPFRTFQRTLKIGTDLKNPLGSLQLANIINKKVIRGGGGFFSTETDYTYVYFRSLSVGILKSCV